MEENKLIINIEAPISTIFNFTINPENTPKWCSGILEEKFVDKDVDVGTIYENTSDNVNWARYKVIGFIKNEYFKLKSEESEYCVEYFYKQVSDKITELTYLERDITLNNPLKQESLEKLKTLIENL